MSRARDVVQEAMVDRTIRREYQDGCVRAVYGCMVTQKWWFPALGPCLTAIAMLSFTLAHSAGSGVWWFALVLGVASAVLGVGIVVAHFRGKDSDAAASG